MIILAYLARCKASPSQQPLSISFIKCLFICHQLLFIELLNYYLKNNLPIDSREDTKTNPGRKGNSPS